jgi:DNA-binding response OmpR family regulator
VTKPFSPREVVLRVQAIPRRGGQAAAEQRVTRFGSGTLVLDEPRQAAMARREAVELTRPSGESLIAPATVPGRVYPRSELINRMRGYELEGYEPTVDSHVKNLRCSIEEDPAHPGIIQTVLGVGYRLGLTRDG